ncbi:Sec1 family protein [Tritrichomonas foetus]|uniref:Sec1 family protein n=1 Tax=Tritrichomonas foetus TaxID=1144522 RepID=A0A1J4K9J8_9EUKA|nr:Sec1 family protein [Tritrichomonas foetus]|eukprot:OHT06125.1 Sec1 family protein [Tritrichomonas foetus]
MTESTQSGLAFTLFKAQSTNDFKDLIKVLPPENRNLTYPQCVEDYVLNVINIRELRGNEISTVNPLTNVNPTKNVGVLIVISPADRDTIEEICKKFDEVPNYIKALLLIPRSTAYVQQVLENHSYISTQACPVDATKEIYVQEFHADFLPIDNDFFLMPCVRSFYQINVENDFNDLYSSARCLAKIQVVFGTIPQVFTLGSMAERVRDLMQGVISQAGSSQATAPQIDSLIIIDRSVDLITPLMTSFCTESLIDELFGINYGILTRPPHIKYGNEDTHKENQIQKILLNETDDLYHKTRFLPISQAGEIISKRLNEFKEIEAVLKERTSKFDEFKENVLKMQAAIKAKPGVCFLLDIVKAVIEESQKNNPILKPMLQKEFDLVRSNTSIIDFAENYVTIFNDWKNALRLIFLEMAVGISHSKGSIQKIEKEIVSEFGLKASEVLITLERLKLLTSSPNQGWQQISKLLGVFKDDEMSKICDQFVPLSVRAVQKATNNDWPGQWGKPFEERKVPVSVVGQPSKSIDGEVRRVLVFFVGGVTLSEAAFIRQMGKVLYKGQVQYIVGSTDSINTNKFMSQICPGFFD